MVSNIREFFRYKLDPCTLALISASVYRREKFKPLFKALVTSAFTLVPHTALVLMLLESGAGKLELTDQTPFKSCELPDRLRWSSREYSLGVSLLPEFLETAEAQRLTARALRAATRWMLFFALREVQAPGDARRWKRTVRLVNTNLHAYGGGARWELRQHIYPRRQQLKQTLGIRAASLLPEPWLLRFASFVRRRWASRSVLVLSEFR